MRILAFINKDSSPAYHRIVLPLMLMPEVDVMITNDFQESFFDKPVDIVIYNRVLEEEGMVKIREMKKKQGFKIIVDIDDFWELDPRHILYEEYAELGFADIQTSHLYLADAVFTTNERLAEAIEPYNSNVHILPNAIPKQGQFDIVREESPFVRLFWQGSVTHRDDIAILEHPISELVKREFHLQMVMAGYTDGVPEWFDMAHKYTTNLRHRYKLIPGEPVTSYYQAYKYADVCLIPLVRSVFNRMKSNLKVLEAANLGLPAIVSQVHPYLGMPVSYCLRGMDWVHHIKRLARSKEARENEGYHLSEYCDQNFNFLKINEERKQILEYEASGSGVLRS